MKVQTSVRARLCGVAFLMALTAGCGGGGGDGGVGPQPPAPPPPPAGPAWSGPASVVLGQTGFDQTDPTGTPAAPLSTLVNGGIAVTSDNRLFVLDGNDVVAFSAYDAANGPAADFRMNRTQLGPFGNVRGISTQGARFVVSADNQVVIYGSAPVDDAATPAREVTVGVDAPPRATPLRSIPRSLLT